MRIKIEMSYKEISVSTDISFTKTRQELINSFLSNFDDHIYFKVDKQKQIKLFVNSLDFRRFEELAIALKLSQKDQKNIELIDEFVNAIGKIGSYSINNGKRVYVGFNGERKVKNRKQKEQRRASTTKKTSAKTITENTLPAKYENKIICGDSLQVLKKMPDNCVDIMLTSPPYNFGLDYQANEDDKKWEVYFQQLFAILAETKRVLKSGGRMIVNVQPLFSDYIPTHHIISKHLMDLGMLWKGEIIWEKNNYNCKYTAWGSWKSPASPYLKYTWEFIEIFSKDDLKHAGDSNNIDISSDEFKKWVIAKWSMAPERNMKEYGHPAMFPEQLVERCLKLFSFKNDVVLDVFNGVGTTTAVAARLERRYIGIDISKDYCKTARTRLLEKLL